MLQKTHDSTGLLFAIKLNVVPGVGLEPTRCHHRGILSPVRLPFRHPGPTYSK